MKNKIRENIFALELFEPGSGTGYSIDAIILNSIEISLLPQATLMDELNSMEGDGLLEKQGDYYRATRHGRIEKQKQLSNSGVRKDSISNQKNYELIDLVLAITVSKKISDGFSYVPVKRDAYCIYLYDYSPNEVESAIDQLKIAGHLEYDTTWLSHAMFVTGQGMQYYQQEVRQRLGLAQNEGVLDLSFPPLIDERFSLLGLDASLTANIQQRWNEIEICANNGAYLASVILLGSVLEGLLLARLQRDIKLAMTSPKAPREYQTTSTKNLKEWLLQDYISVSVDLGFIPRSVEKHIHELRDTRNLVHPNKQISSNILVDESLYRISKEVAETVIDALLPTG